MFRTLAGFVMGWVVFTDEGNKMAKSYFRQLKKDFNSLFKEGDNGKRKEL